MHNSKKRNNGRHTGAQENRLKVACALNVINMNHGYPVFDPVARTVASTDEDEIFFCRGSGADGKGLYTSEGFVVLRGSVARRENVPSIIGTPIERMRERLMKSGVFEEQGDKLVFARDHLFGSPSMAAMSLMGRTANGWSSIPKALPRERFNCRPG